MTPAEEVIRTSDGIPLLGVEGFRGSLPWFAVRVREKSRAAAEEMLTAQGFTLFSPLTTDLRQWSDRVKVLSVPLFAGYLFCRFDPQSSLRILRTVGVIDIVRCGKHFAEVDATELEAVYKALHVDPLATAVPYLAEGERVRVVRGPLRDVEGILTKVKSRLTLILAVTMMNRSVAVQIDRALVEAV